VSRPRPSLMPWEMTTGSMSTYATRASAATSRAAARASCPPWAARRRYRGTAGCPLPRPGTGRRGPGTPGSPAPRPRCRGSAISRLAASRVLGEVVLAA
jgi:hypothetical protein